MKIYIDGDACSVKGLIANIIKQFKDTEVVVVVDKSRVVPSYFQNVVVCEIGTDSVDKEIINRAESKDIVITQDYDLAAILVKKSIKVLHPSGWMFTEVSIMTKLANRSFFRLMREFGYKQKKLTAKKKKRKKEIGRMRLEQTLGKLLKQDTGSSNESSRSS